MDNSQLTRLIEAYGTLAAIVAIGLVVIVFCLTSLIAYRRHIDRQRKLTQNRAARDPHLPKEKPADLWRTGGQRLTQNMDPPVNEEDLPDEDEDEDDEDDRWWKRGES